MLRWALLLLAGCDGVFGIQHIATPDAAIDTPPDAPIAYTAAVLADHPVGFWPLDEVSGVLAHDLVGGHDGQLRGTGVALGVTPPYPSMGHAMGFDGVDASVDIGDQFGFAGTQPYSIEAWFSPRTHSDTEFYEIISKWREPGAMSDPTGWNVYYSQSSPVVQYTREAVGHVTLDDRLAAGYMSGWHHVVATMDDTTMTMTLYYDGAEADSTAVTFGLDTIPEHLEIGAGNGDPRAATMFGSICQVAIFDYALTPSQINAHYNARSL